MNTGNKIAFFYTALTVGAIALVAVIVFIVASCFIYQGMADLPADRIGLSAGRLILFLGLTLLGLVLLSSFLVYFVGRRYASRMLDRIDATYHTEKTFISSASHELNNPLTAIQGECEITLLKERTPIEYQIALQRIASETKRIIQLMKQLLVLSHGQEEILKNVVEPIPLADFLMQFAQNRVSFSPDNFAFVVNANPNLFKIAIGNMLNNALKYSPADKPVELRLSGGVLEIKDYGIGIPPEELEHIAQPFFRASNTREYNGHGVGLSLSIHILNTYGAKVTIISAVEEGTCIRIEFP